MSFNTQPLQEVIPAYLYAQYSDDANMQAFISAFNGLAQGYLDWFNQNPLGVYTNPNMTGSFLDWIGSELYGVPRPIVGLESSAESGYYGSATYANLSYAEFSVSISGSAQEVSDDIYKRVMTWFLYLGDGKQMSIPWVKRRVARFLYGANGADISVSEVEQIGVSQPLLDPQGAYGSADYARLFYAEVDSAQPTAKHSYQIQIAESTAARQFSALLGNGVLRLPFQINFTISIQG